MNKFPLIIAALALSSLPAMAQRLAPPENPNPQSTSDVLNEPIPNPIRNTPAGQAPLMVPGAPISIEMGGSGQAKTQECQSHLFDALYTVSDWQPSARKANALKELKAARVAILGGDPRTCEAHIGKALR